MENKDPQLPEKPLIQLIPASLPKRFANYLIDVIIFSFFLCFLLVLLSPVYPLMQKIMAKQPIELSDQLMMSFLYGLYLSVMEAVLKGKTIGKFITGTRAVTVDGLPIGSRTAFARGLIRLIPFEQVSAISIPPYPWHDRWSNSVVVDEKKSVLPKRLTGRQRSM